MQLLLQPFALSNVHSKWVGGTRLRNVRDVGEGECNIGVKRSVSGAWVVDFVSGVEAFW